jgi:alpha,alpha-trehalase
LKADGREDLVESMIEDFGSLIDRYGHVPNGARSYYLSRSQPPLFYAMAALSSDKRRSTRRRRLGWMRQEHAYWMAGAAGLRPLERRAHRSPGRRRTC